MNLTLFILLNSAPDFRLQNGLINERITLLLTTTIFILFSFANTIIFK